MPKEATEQPLTSSQTYGWREPIDNLRTEHKRTGMCQKTFVDHGHLQWNKCATQNVHFGQKVIEFDIVLISNMLDCGFINDCNIDKIQFIGKLLKECI